MEINSMIQNTASTANNNNNSIARTAQQKSQEKTTTLAAENVDKFDDDSVNANRNRQNSPERAGFINVQGYRGKSTLQMKNALVADFVNANMTNQSRSHFGNSLLDSIFTPRSFALNAFNAAEATSSKHADYWGVEATAERIFTFAKTLAGDNDELFSTMKNAFLKGFNLAAGAARGRLPDISGQTKARVLELFDAWEAEIAARRNPAPVE
jgi:hypothetical protein